MLPADEGRGQLQAGAYRLTFPAHPGEMLEAFMLLGPDPEEVLIRRALCRGAVCRWRGVLRHLQRRLDGQGKLRVLHRVLRDIMSGVHYTR